MNKDEKLRAIEQWQTSGMIHPLTCRVQSTHDLLVAYVEDDDVTGLKCITCGFIQKPVPVMVYDALDDHHTFREMFGGNFEEVTGEKE